MGLTKVVALLSMKSSNGLLLSGTALRNVSFNSGGGGGMISAVFDLGGLGGGFSMGALSELYDRNEAGLGGNIGRGDGVVFRTGRGGGRISIGFVVARKATSASVKIGTGGMMSGSFRETPGGVVGIGSGMKI